MTRCEASKDCQVGYDIHYLYKTPYSLHHDYCWSAKF
jgi:hypothetical protein